MCKFSNNDKVDVSLNILTTACFLETAYVQSELTHRELQAYPDTYNYNPKITSSRLVWAT